MDQFVVNPPEGWPRWMQNQIEQADFVLHICTETYKRRFEGHEESGKGEGVDWEGRIITQLLYNDAKSTKSIPVLFEDETKSSVPLLLQSHTLYHLPDDFDQLCRHVTEQSEDTSTSHGGRPHTGRQYLRTVIQAHVVYLQKRLRTPAEGPYKGLFYYELEDEKIFCGRETREQAAVAMHHGARQGASDHRVARRFRSWQNLPHTRWYDASAFATWHGPFLHCA